LGGARFRGDAERRIFLLTADIEDAA